MMDADCQVWGFKLAVLQHSVCAFIPVCQAMMRDVLHIFSFLHIGLN